MARRTTTPQEPRKVALGFIGLGESTIENTTDLLEDYLGVVDGQVPDDDVLDLRIAFPVTKPHLGDGLKGVLKWTDKHELAYDAFPSLNEAPSKAITDILDFAEEKTPVKNVEKALLDWLRDAQEEGYEARLIVLWGEDGQGDEAAEIALDLATSYDIKALDLTAGLDALSFDEEEQPEAAPEPEPVVEEKPKRRPRPARPSEEAEEQKPARRSRKASEPEPEEDPNMSGVLDDEIEAEEAEIKAGTWTDFVAERKNDPQALTETLGDPHKLLGILIEALDADPHQNENLVVAKQRLHEAFFWLNRAYISDAYPNSTPRLHGDASVQAAEEPVEASEEPKRGRGRPRTRSAAEKAVTEIWDEEDQKWVRAGRGRVPKDAKTRKVDAETGDVI